MPTEIVLGPPGTGKTTYLLEQMEQELGRGVPPQCIGFVSFTRRATIEARDRAMAQFKLAKIDLPWIRTLHSLCFKALGLSASEVLEGKKLQEFADWIKMPISGVSTEEGLPEFGFQAGDRCLYIDNLARMREVSLRSQYDAGNEKAEWKSQDFFSRGLAEFKQTRGLIDYTDMLSQLVASQWQPYPRLEVLLVDEAQDLSMLQWRVVEHLAKGVRRVIIAGDDDQAIYRWAGAAIEHFIELTGDTVTVLDHSWRVPPEVQKVALDIVSDIKKRRPKLWHPRDGRGEVLRAPKFEYADIDLSQETLILSRNTRFLPKEALRRQGILYEYRGHPSVRQSLIDAIKYWEHLRRGGEIMVTQAEQVYNEMRAGVGYTRGHKKLPAWHEREQMITLQDLQEAGGLLTDAIWHEALTRVPEDERVYMTTILQKGQKLTERPKVRISTIHGAKGGQADHVVLFTDVGRLTLQETRLQPDDEARTWYVATTRAKQKMTILAPQDLTSYYRI